MVICSLHHGLRNMMTTIGDRIKKARLAIRMTQTELAHRAGVSGATVRDLEDNVENTTPHIAKLAHALGVAPLWLARGEGDPKDGVIVSGPREQERLPPEVIAIARQLLKLPDAKLQAFAVLLDIELAGSPSPPPGTAPAHGRETDVD